MDEAAVAEAAERGQHNVAIVEDEALMNDQSSVDSDHGSNGVFFCQICGDAFKDEATHLIHLEQHSQQDSYEEAPLDDESEVETDHKTPLQDFHPQEKTPEKGVSDQLDTRMIRQRSFSCEECGKSYDMLGHLLNHQKKHRQASKSVFFDLEHLKKKAFQCEICGRSYSRASALDAHRRCHEEKLVKKCKSSPESLGSELKIERFDSKVERFDSKVERFDSKAERFDSKAERFDPKVERFDPKVERFDPRVEQIEPRVERFDSKVERIEPRVEHINPSENPTESENTAVEISFKQSFECPCGKSFSSLMGLKAHQRFSRNESCSPEELFKKEKSRDFKCKHCDKTFSGPKSLLSHERWHFQPAQKYPCEECGRVFKTLNFYERHQRLAHSNMVASKSFLHQVCQLRKRSFECKVCGLKFTRASALNSHELLHTDVYKDTRLPQSDHEYVSIQPKPSEQSKKVQYIASDRDLNDTTDEDSLEPGDLIVKVISSSDSEEISEEDENSDLELVCESDQEEQDGCDLAIHKKVVSKPHVDLKIVQVDYGETVPTRTQSHKSPAEERFSCPDCYRWFDNAASLRVHRMWHDVRRRRLDTQGQSETVQPLDLSCRQTVKRFQGTESIILTNSANLVNLVEKTSSVSDLKREYNPKKTLLGPKVYHCEQCGKGFWSLGAFSHHKQSPLLCTELRLRKGFGGPFTNGHSRTSFKVACPVCGRKFRHKGIMALHMRKHENGDHKCEICNRSFRLFSGLLRHSAVHNNQSLPPPIKSFQYQVENLQKNTYSCPDCGKLFSRAKALQFHMKSHGYETGYSPPSHKSTETKADLQCSSCFAVFNKKSSLHAHSKRCTTRLSSSQPKEENLVNSIKKEKKTNDSDNVKTEDSKYKCKVCDQSFSVIGALNFHKRSHTESQKALTKAKALIKKSKQDDSSKGLFSCSVCGRRFVSNAALGTHKRWHKDKPFVESSQGSEELGPDSKKAESGPFECNKCHKKFFNLYVLQRHQLVNFQCKKAEQMISFVSSENTLSVQHEIISCPDCYQNFDNNSLLADHMKSVHGESLAQVKTVHSVKIHKHSSLSKSQSKTKIHWCTICSLSFKNIRGLRTHKWQVHSETRGKEKTENNLSLDKQNDLSLENGAGSENASAENGTKSSNGCLSLQTNLSNNSNDNYNTQITTLKEENDKQTPDTVIALPPQHFSELTNKFLFKCEKCGKAFTAQEQLENHKTKAKIRPFSCALCCSGFWTENQLQQHFIWHDKMRGSLPNELRFRINAATTLATNVFPSDRNISALSDPVVIPDDRESSRHECQNCGKVLITPLALQKHKIECCNTGSYHCSSCPSIFRNIQELIDHHQKCAATVPSGGNGYSCFECEATFTQKKDLHQHYTEHATCVCD